EFFKRKSNEAGNVNVPPVSHKVSEVDMDRQRIKSVSAVLNNKDMDALGAKQVFSIIESILKRNEKAFEGGGEAALFGDIKDLASKLAEKIGGREFAAKAGKEITEVNEYSLRIQKIIKEIELASSSR
ncbi:MAG: hypothetical protein ACP5MK_03675, partial [Candidatus Micrarchaeia archaeon]